MRRPGDEGLGERCLKETVRLCHLAQTRDALNRIGSLLYRGSLKYTFITTVATGIGHELPRLGLPGLDTLLAVALPAMVFLLAFGGGLCLKYIPNLISLGRIATAEAADFNLMKDYRKARVAEHLDELWDRVFAYEAQVCYAPAEIEEEERRHERCIGRLRQVVGGLEPGLLEYLGVGTGGDCSAGRRDGVDGLVEALLCAHPQCRRMERTRRSFYTSARFALREHIEQERQTGRIGFDLSQWEDWRDSACFHSSDQHLRQQYDANATLSAVKDAVGWGLGRAIRELPKKTAHSLWFYLLARAISVHLGAHLAELDRKYLTRDHPNTFKAQLLMWPGAERYADWLDELPRAPRTRVRRAREKLRRLYLPGLRQRRPLARGLDRMAGTLCGIAGMRFSCAREEVLARRRHLIRSRFGRTWRDALEVVDRAYLTPFELATELRLAYDAEYAAGMLEQTPADDYRGAGAAAGRVERHRRESDRRGRELRAFLSFAGVHRPRIVHDAEAQRAVAVAFHLDEGGLKREFRRARSEFGRMRPAVDRAIDGRRVVTARLYAVRMHQALAVLQIKEARQYVRELAYNEGDEPAGEAQC